MSVEYLTAAFQDRKTTGATRLVLLALANISDHSGASWPSYDYLSAAAGVSLRSAQAAVAELKSLGLLAVQPRTRPESGRRWSNLYRLLLVEGCRDCTPEEDRGVQNLRGRGAESAREGCRDCTPLKREDTSEDTSEDTKRARANGFEQWWAAYPRKVGRRTALTAWQRLKKSGELPPLEEVLAATERQSDSRQWSEEGGRYVPHPTTWLNRGGWGDREPSYRQVMGYDGELHYVPEGA